MASLFETICFMRVCGTPVALLFLAAPIVAGLAAVTVPAAVAPIAPSSSDQKQRDGEEFSNNLVSDLAPLLALFGERFAQQFMSISTSWMDSVVFAMAPLGIITAIVGAIRVGGASGLKSLIGRARETRAAAEVELMSSTSHEVCEIWNGDAIVRVMGTPDIEQFIYFDGLPEQLYGKELPSNNGWALYTLKEAVDVKLLIERGQRTFYERLPKWFPKRLVASIDNDDVNGGSIEENGESAPQRSEKAAMNTLVHSILRQRKPHTDEEQARKENPCAQPIASILGKFKRSSAILSSDTGGRKDHSPHSDQDNSAPNVSLNLGLSKHPLELYAAGIFGIIVQLAVLVVAGMATYYPRLEFQKGGLTVRNYAYPLCGVGILLQSVGMFICASVIEQSTIEHTWVKCDEAKAARMICFWVQRRRVINDQEFDSFAVFAKRPVEFVMTSRRRKARDLKVQYPSAVTPFVTASGVAVSIMGFILNFMGLRGLHWSATMAQLAATGIMTIVRAVIRRGISSRPHAIKMEEGFELDWLAGAVLKDPKNFGPQYDNPKADSKQAQTGNSFETGELKRMTSTQALNSISKDQSNRDMLKPTVRIITGGNPAPPDRQGSRKAMSLIKTREHLGRLSKWKGPASEPAVAAANAIEVAMNTFFTEEDANSLRELTRLEDGGFTFSWIMDVDVQLGGPTGDGHDGQVSLSVTKKNGSNKWHVIAEEIEALLSLWLQHISIEEAKENDRSHSAGETDDDWLRQKQQQKNMRFLGPDTVALRRDLQWWVPNSAIGLLQVQNGVAVCDRVPQASIEPTHQIIDYHRITGFYAPKNLPDSCPAVRFECTPISPDCLDTAPKNQAQLVYQACTSEIQPVVSATHSEPLADNTSLAMVTSINRDFLFAQHIFTAFISALARKIDRIQGKSQAFQRAMTNRPTAWQHFRLENTVVSTLALAIESTGLGTLEEALLCIIPPFSMGHRLPAGAAVDLVLRSMEKDENVLNWERSEEVYNELLNFGTLFHSPSCLFTVRAAAAAVECLKRMSNAKELYSEDPKGPNAQLLDQAMKNLSKGLTDLISNSVKKVLRELYKRQRRTDEYEWFMQLGTEDPESLASTDKHTPDPLDKTPYTIQEMTKELGFSPMHNHIVNGTTFSADLPKRDVFARDILGWTPLHYAVMYTENHNYMQELLKLDADPNESDIFGFTPLHYAASKNNFSQWEQLLSKGQVKISAKARDQTTALHIAAKNGHAQSVQKLLDRKAQVDVQDSIKRTPLHWATYRQNPEIIELLMKSGTSGAAVNLQDFQQKTALHVAAGYKIPQCTKLLIEHSHREARDQTGKTALHISAMKGHHEVVELLLIHTAHADATDNNGSTPLHLAVSGGHFNVVETLLKRKVSTEARDATENTVLHIATLHSPQSAEIVELLLNHNADSMARDGKNRIALQIAAKKGIDSVVELLLEQKGVGEAIDNDEYQALYDAAKAHEQTQKPPEQDQTEGGGYFKICQRLLQREKDRELLAVVAAGNTSNESVTKDNFQTAINVPQQDLTAEKRFRKTALHVAAENGHDCTAKLLVARDLDIEARTDLYRSALHLAAMYGYKSLTQILLDKSADCMAKDLDGNTALHLAVAENHHDVVQLLLAREASVDATNQNGQTALHIATSLEDSKMVIGILLDHQATTDFQDPCGNTALHLAVKSNNSIVTELLLLQNANVNAINKKGRTPLSLAAKRGHLEVSQLLLKYNADVNIHDTQHGSSALQLATAKRREEVVKLLVESGAHPNVANNSGKSPLHEALSDPGSLSLRNIRISFWLYGSRRRESTGGPSHAIAELLLSHGAVVDTADNKGNTVLHMAAKQGQTEVIELLLVYKAAIDARNLRGRRALHMAAKRGYIRIVNLIVDQKPDLDAKDVNADTALHLAIRSGRDDVVQFLLNRGASTDIKNVHGKNPDFQLALTSEWMAGQESVALVLVERSKGDSIGFKDDYNRTALHWACLKAYDKLVETLLGRGEVAVNSQDNSGETALHVTVQRGAVNIAKNLLEKGASIEIEDVHGRTPFVRAAIGRQGDIIKLMCEKCPSQKRYYDTALQIAVLRLQLDIVCQLLKLGANPDGKDEHGWSANLCCTQSKPNPAMAELLTPGSSQCLQSLPLTDTLGPTRFSAKKKMTSMQLHNDGLEVSFEVDGNVDSEDALIQSNHPLPPLREIFGASDVDELTVYFEITVVEGGSPSIVGLGLNNGPVPRFDRFPGWDAESWGYHGDDGFKFASSGSGTKYGETYGIGDTLGCGVNSERRMFFTKNGRSLGFAFEGVFGQLFPIVGLTKGCRIRINFSEPFVYDLQTKVDIAENKQTTASESGNEAGNAENPESLGRLQDIKSLSDRFADAKKTGEEGEEMGSGYGDSNVSEDCEMYSNAAQGGGSDF